jgi:hypothetical protein
LDEIIFSARFKTDTGKKRKDPQKGVLPETGHKEYKLINSADLANLLEKLLIIYDHSISKKVDQR